MQLDIFKMEAWKEVETANKAAFDHIQTKLEETQDERDAIKWELELMKTAHENMKLEQEKIESSLKNKFKDELDVVIWENEAL